MEADAQFSSATHLQLLHLKRIEVLGINFRNNGSCVSRKY